MWTLTCAGTDLLSEIDLNGTKIAIFLCVCMCVALVLFAYVCLCAFMCILHVSVGVDCCVLCLFVEILADAGLFTPLGSAVCPLRRETDSERGEPCGPPVHYAPIVPM